MKILRKISVAVLVLPLMFGLAGSTLVSATTTTPSLGGADTFGVLVNTFVRNFSGTAITGDLGYTTFSGTATYTVSGTTHVGDGTYNQAVTDAGTALANLNSQTCTHTFPVGTIDLATDTTHGALGVYTPGVYCSSSPYGVSIGAAGITLSGSGTYIFRFNGSITTATNSHVTLENGASPCNVFWTLADNAIVSTLGATSTFSGTLFDTVSLSMHNNVIWTGRAILSSGSVGISYDDQIFVPTSCTTPPPPSPATLHIIKHVVNNDGGSATASSFYLHVKSSGSMGGNIDVAGSSAIGIESPGRSYSLAAGNYVVSEDYYNGYTSTFSGDCDASGNIPLTSGADKTCTITNDDIALPPPPTPAPATLHVIKHVVNDDGSKEIASDFILHVKSAGSMGGNVDVSGSPAAGIESPGRSYSLGAGTYAVSEEAHSGYTQSFSGDCDSNGNVSLSSGDNKTCTITNNDIAVKTPPPPTSASATLHVIKVVINDNGGKAVVSDATVHVANGSGDVLGSPQPGASSPGTSYALDAGAYTVSEDFFPGYTVLLGGDCTASGNVVLTPGDNKICTITNNDIAGVVIPPPTITPPTIINPPTSVPPTCDICARLTYDVYIINPDGTQRHTGTPWVKVTDRGNGVKRYSFEDATIDPHNPLYDYNDSVIDVDLKDCKGVKFMFISSDASWKHQIRIKVSIDGVVQSDALVTNDSKSVVGTSKTINATTGVNTTHACLLASSGGLLGRILLQIQAHGEAWYVRPESGRRYYMKDGSVAYGMMRNFGLGITDQNLAAIPSVETVDELKSSTSACFANSPANNSKGKILLQVQAHGEAWYVDASKCRRIYMKDGAAAYTLMRFLGLGITNTDLAKLKIGL